MRISDWSSDVCSSDLIDDIGLFELNEAFAIQVISLLDHFGIADDDPRVNPWGGAIAIGHPLAASGVHLMIQLAAHFQERPDVRYGLTALCVGLGRSEEHTSELQSLLRISYAVFCLKKKQKI